MPLIMYFVDYVMSVIDDVIMLILLCDVIDGVA